MRNLLIVAVFGAVFAGGIVLFRDVAAAFMAAALVASAAALQTRPAQ